MVRLVYVNQLMTNAFQQLKIFQKRRKKVRIVMYKKLPTEFRGKCFRIKSRGVLMKLWERVRRRKLKRTISYSTNYKTEEKGKSLKVIRKIRIKMQHFMASPKDISKTSYFEKGI